MSAPSQKIAAIKILQSQILIPQDVWRNRLAALHLQWSRSSVAAGRLCSHEFKRGEFQIGGAFQEIEYLDTHHLAGFSVVGTDGNTSVADTWPQNRTPRAWWILRLPT